MVCCDSNAKENEEKAKFAENDEKCREGEAGGEGVKCKGRIKEESVTGIEQPRRKMEKLMKTKKKKNYERKTKKKSQSRPCKILIRRLPNNETKLINLIS